MSDVLSFKESFVGLSVPKVAFWTDKSVELCSGQHQLESTSLAPDPIALEIFHLPIRWKSELTKRGLNYEPRRATKRRIADESWQSSFHGSIVLDGKTDEVWAANSSDSRGPLDLYGAPRQLIRDTRLRNTLLQAGIHMLRYRWKPATPQTAQPVSMDRQTGDLLGSKNTTSSEPIAYLDDVVFEGLTAKLRGWAISASGRPAAEIMVRWAGNADEIAASNLSLVRQRDRTL